jgi:hypothetical protein
MIRNLDEESYSRFYWSTALSTGLILLLAFGLLAPSFAFPLIDAASFNQKLDTGFLDGDPTYSVLAQEDPGVELLPQSSSIVIDGNMSDWQGVPRLLNDTIGDPGLGLDIDGAYVTNDAEFIYFRVDYVNSSGFQMLWSNVTVRNNEGELFVVMAWWTTGSNGVFVGEGVSLTETCASSVLVVDYFNADYVAMSEDGKSIEFKIRLADVNASSYLDGVFWESIPAGVVVDKAPDSGYVTYYLGGSPLDLTAEVVNVRVAEQAHRFKVSVKTLVCNIGYARSPRTTFDVFLSDDNTLDSGDSLVGGRNVHKIKPGDCVELSSQLFLPTDPLGSWVIVKADSGNQVQESDESNNVDAFEIEPAA